MKCALNYPSILTLASFFLFSACGAQKVPNGVTTTGDARLNTADPLTEVLHPGDEVRDPEQADVPIKSELVKPLALIYKGPGACSLDQDDAGESGYGCSEAAADVATAAGFQYKFVGPDALPNNPTPAQVSALFGKAKVWMQPGGIAVTAYLAMSSGLKKEVKKFIYNGGGYVGFCAGAFLATSQIGSTNYSGFGIFPGSTAPYSYSLENNDVGYAFLKSTWDGKKRFIYFEGGPYIYGQGNNAEVTATFGDGYTLAARANYGAGRVYITGGHPEAPAIWPGEDGLSDPDGLDYDIGASMVRWASGL